MRTLFQIPQAVKLFLLSALFLSGCSVGKTGPFAHDLSRTPAENFVLKDVHGIAHALSDYRGSVVVLSFGATWCFSCEEELAAFEELQTYFRDQNFEVLAVFLTDENRSLPKAKRKLTMLLDEGHRIAKRYGIDTLPVSFVLDKQGRFVDFPDPASGVEKSRFEGPRGWNALPTVKALEALIAE